MSLVVPNVSEVIALEFFLERALTLKLFANDVIPAEDSTAGSFTEVTGGGYASAALGAGDWTITPGSPTVATQDPVDFNFSGPTDGSGNIYGYFVVDGSGVLAWAERFSEAVIPFAPASASLVRITPRFEAS